MNVAIRIAAHSFDEYQADCFAAAFFMRSLFTFLIGVFACNRFFATNRLGASSLLLVAWGRVEWSCCTIRLIGSGLMRDKALDLARILCAPLGPAFVSE